jgi:hypothetical protein
VFLAKIVPGAWAVALANVGGLAFTELGADLGGSFCNATAAVLSIG